MDRFYVGHIGLGFLKLYTLGGLFIWMAIDWFVIRRSTRVVNISIAHDVMVSIVNSR